MLDLDLTKKEDVVILMGQSGNVNEWNANCEKVKAVNNGNYPEFWYSDIIGGVLWPTKMKWDWW